MSVALFRVMQARDLHPHTVRVTWLEVGERTYYLIARCAQCVTLVERQLDDMDHDEGIFEMIGIELLCAHGCEHAEHAPGSGLRPALGRS